MYNQWVLIEFIPLGYSMILIIKAGTQIIYKILIDKKYIKQSQQLIMIAQLQSFLQIIEPECTVSQLYTIDLLIQELDYAQGDHTKKFTNHINIYIQAIEQNLNDATTEQKRSLIDIAVQCITLYEKVFQKNLGSVDRILNLLILIMVDVPEEVPQEWYSPPPGHKEDEIDELQAIDPASAVVLEFRHLIDQLASAIGYQKFTQKFKTKLIQYYTTNQNDWRWRSAILMVISQLTQQIQIQTIIPFVELAIKASNDVHPKVRYSAAQVIGQLSDDLKPDFQDKFYQELFPIFIKKINDPIQRVSSHWLACLTNFVEDWNEPTLITPYLYQLLQNIHNSIVNGNSITKENGISALASFSTVNSLLNQETIQKMFEISQNVFHTFDVEGVYNQLNNQTIEFVTILLTSQPYPLVHNFINPTVQRLFNIGKKLDPEYFLSGWSRLCIIKKQFIGWQNVYELILQTAVNFCSEKEIKRFEVALNSINNTVDCFKEKFNPYVNPTLQQLKVMMNENTFDQQILMGLFETISLVVCKAKPYNPEDSWKNIVLSTIQFLFEKIKEQQTGDDLKIINSLFDYFKDLTDEYAILMNPTQLEQIFMNLMNSRAAFSNRKAVLFSEISQMKQNIQTINNQVDATEVQNMKTLKEDEVQSLNKAILSIPDLLFSIITPFKSIDLQFSSMVNILINHISPIISEAENKINNIYSNDKFIKKHLYQDIRYSLYIIDNLIEMTEYEKIASHWNNIQNVLKNYCLHPIATIRNSAVFGLNLIIEKTPFVNSALINQWKQTLLEGKNLAKFNGQQQKEYNHCYDNFIAAIGKLIRCHGGQFEEEIFPLYDLWLRKLPLKEDKTENKNQMKILNDIVLHCPEKIISDVDSLKRLIKVYAKVIKGCVKKLSKEENRQILRGIKEVIKNVIEWAIFKDHREELVNSLGDKYKFYLNNLLETDSYTYE